MDSFIPRPARLALAVAFVTAVACGGTPPEGSGPQFGETTSPANISVHGSITLTKGTGDTISCISHFLNPVSVAFADASGTLLATTQAKVLPQPMLASSGPCLGIGKYHLSVPQSDLYQVQVDGQSVGSVSLADLQSADYVYDIDAA